MPALPRSASPRLAVPGLACLALPCRASPRHACLALPRRATPCLPCLASPCRASPRQARPAVLPVTLSGIGKKPIACALESDRVNVHANHGAQQAVEQRLSALPRDCSPIARHIAQPIDTHKEAHNVAQRMRVLSFDSLRSALPCAPSGEGAGRLQRPAADAGASPSAVFLVLLAPISREAMPRPSSVDAGQIVAGLRAVPRSPSSRLSRRCWFCLLLQLVAGAVRVFCGALAF